MRYHSTRGHPDRFDFAEVLLQGLAPDGGLFVPDSWPHLTSSAAISYPHLVAEVLAPFIEPDPLAGDLTAICVDAYAGFRHEAVAPVRAVGGGTYLLELFWGPTLSFKDYALAVVGRLLERVVARTGERVVILGATSGDTGSAAIDACRGRDNMDVVILFPAGRVSEVQRRQMTTIPDPNVTTIAVQGTFDDCQRLVKQALADPDLGLRTASINSINWARVATQTAYYFWAADRAGLDQASFAVPTGNFGDVFAGWVARRCGGPVARLIVANNANHGLTDLIEGRGLTVTAVEPTTAPAMDIQVPSNLERYLFELAGGNPARVRTWQKTLAAVGRLELKPAEHAAMAADFTAGWLPDSEVPETIREVYESADLVLDPHTAIAWKVGERLRSPGEALITIATAHPAKFPEVVTTALGFTPALPDDLADLADRPERIHTIATDYGALRKLLAGLGSADA